MAEKENSNIKLIPKLASTGLNMENVPEQIEQGKLSYALNAAVEHFDDSSISYQNEIGNEFCVEFPEGFVMIGNHIITEQNKIIFFITNPITKDSQIGYMINNDCAYHILIEHPDLNFNIHHPILKCVHRIDNCCTEIYWTDGYNPRRHLDIDNIPLLIKSGTPLCDPVYKSEIDINQLNVQPDFAIPLIKVTEERSSGNLKAGTYQFAIQYSDSFGNPLTSYYNPTNPFSIADTDIISVNYDYPVSKSIVVEVSNIDISGLYSHINIAVIKTINNISSYELVGTYDIDNSIKRITYTGQQVTNRQLSANDIFERFPYYEIAQDLTTAQDILIWDQLTSIDRINYQKIANKVKLQWQTHRIPSTESYADGVNTANFRSYMRDEIYAFEIQFLLKNGKETDGFHIPGRKLLESDLVTDDISQFEEDFVGTPSYYIGEVGYSPYWKIYNTANVEGFFEQYNNSPNYKGPYQYGNFGYHESTELYPCNEEIWGDLANMPIRHHRFPDIETSPIFESRTFTGTFDMAVDREAIFPIGVLVNPEDIYYQIQNSSLTTQQKSQIVGFRILRGNRSTNKSIVAKGLLRNTNKYTRDDKEYYFANYPYNDLGKDVFLNKDNNAYLNECQPYNIAITHLDYNEFYGDTVAVLSYTDCNTHKNKTKIYKELGSDDICSIDRPVFVVGDGTATNSEYDVYHILGKPKNPLLYHPYTISYESIIKGTTEQIIENNVEYYINVVKDTKPVCIKNCKDTNEDYIRFFRSVRLSGKCDKVESLPEAENNNILIFNSPDTSFGNPFLGDILKLESVIFGKGKAHFTEVKDNPKYKLISKEAQIKALDQSVKIGKITKDFNAQAMFASYQAYLTTTLHDITRKNFAYSFNSIANYNYSLPIPDGKGIKQRNIDKSRYLIPSIITLGDITINNWQRESSVVIQLDDKKSLLPFPHLSEPVFNGTSSMIVDKSRHLISTYGNCATPGADEDIHVISYYASMKKDNPSQWGQIYSYETLSTGYEYIFGKSDNIFIFGGDTFINKFAFKTKLPFFRDNRVGGPDDSDIFFDEIGNVAYPKYWHSARSIIEDYYTVKKVGEKIKKGSPEDVFPNLISYKAHNFDCSNEYIPIPKIEEETTEEFDDDDYVEDDSFKKYPDYYDGYFYLFAYGIPNFYCESEYNVDLRQAYNNKEGDFFPHVGNDIPDDWLQEKNVSIANDNTYYYNTTFSKQNKENYFTHLPTDWSKELCYTHYPFRAIYSDRRSDDSDNRINNWKIYRPFSKFDFPQNNGKLISLEGVQNQTVLARFENKTLLYNKLIALDTTTPKAVYIGNPNLFKGSPPIDYTDTDLGYIGTQHKLFLKLPVGQLTIDAKRGSVFLLQGEGIKNISGPGSGMNRFFKDHLPFKILKHYPDVNIDNHYNGIGLHAVYDAKYERIIITKIDYEPLVDNIEYKDGKYYLISSNYNIEINLSDDRYFCNKSWTLSYNLITNSWISFHSYIPNFYIPSDEYFYSGMNDCCGDFDFIAAYLPTDNECDINGECECSPIQECDIIGNCNIGELDDCDILGRCICSPVQECDIIGDCECSPIQECDIIGESFADIGCRIIGEAFADERINTDCDIDGEVKVCERPDYLNYYSLIHGYSYDTITRQINTLSDACGLYTLMFQERELEYHLTGAFSDGIYSGAHLFAANGTMDCECVPDGWYIPNISSQMAAQLVIYVEDCIIVRVETCEFEIPTPDPEHDCSIEVEPGDVEFTQESPFCDIEGDVYIAHVCSLEIEAGDVEFFECGLSARLINIDCSSETTEDETSDELL